MTPRNMARILAETGANQLHVAAQRSCSETSANNNRAIFYGGCLYPPEDRFQLIDREAVGGMVAAVRMGEAR